MRVRSWDQLGLDRGRVAVVVLSVSGLFFVVVAAVGSLLEAGATSVFLAPMSALGAAYLLLTAPRRALRAAAFQQTLEAPSFAASSNIYLKATGSRSKTLIMVRSEEPALKEFLGDVRRKILLGYDAPSATRESSPASHLLSESATTVVESVVGANRARVEEGGEELDLMLGSSGLEDETKLPVLIAVAFFLPIMLMLFAALAKETGPASLAALLVLEVVVLDLTLGISSGSVSWKGAA